MASVSGTTNNLNSLYNTYGNANTITGLASGMDTETMIEQAVSGYQKKIESLQKKQTLLQWKQTEMRGYITMLNNLTNNYGSYRSKTNLLSPSFFTGNMTSSAIGSNAYKISTSGGSNSSIAINAVTKLATGAMYQVDAGAVFGGTDCTGVKIIWGGVNLSEVSDQSIDVTVDGVSKSIRIGDLGDLKQIRTTDNLAAALQAKLDVAFGKDRVTVASDGGALSFSTTKGSTIMVTSEVSELGLGDGVRNYIDPDTTNVVDSLCTKLGEGFYQYNGKYYVEVDGELVDSSGKKLSLEINGTKIAITTKTTITGLMSNINLSDAGVTAAYSQLTKKITFTSKNTGAGSEIKLGGDLGKAFQTNNSPDNLMASSLFSNIKWDENGEAVIKFSTGGEDSRSYELTLNRNDTFQTLIKKISRLGGTEDHPGDFQNLIQYDSASGTYGLFDEDGNPLALEDSTFSFSIPGSNRPIKLSEILEDANDLNPIYTAGQDAELTVTINGTRMNLTRSSNTFDIDGMSVTLRGTFNVGEDGKAIEGEPVTFESHVDTENVVSAVKSFIEDYNALMKAIRTAYTTQPEEKSSSTHAKYEPLTDSEKEGLSEKTIEEYEQKAKTGMFFMDSELSGLYSRLSGILSANRVALADIGISIQYDSDSRTNYLELDEEALSAALVSNPNKVAEVFAGTGGEGGLMTDVQSVVKEYGSTSTGDYGILVRKAGAAESAISQLASNNAYQKELESLEEQIDTWKTKLSAKIDYYSRQFSMLEQLMGTYNNQSSMLMSMMGY